MVAGGYEAAALNPSPEAPRASLLFKEVIAGARVATRGLAIALKPVYADEKLDRIEVEVHDKEHGTYYRVVKLVRVRRIPREVAQVEALIEMHRDVVAGLRALVYGPPATWSGERRAKVYLEEGYVVVELLPRVQITTAYEAGARVYVVRVELFRLDLPQGLSQLEPHKAVGPKGSQELAYARGYDYLGTSRVYLNDELVESLSVVKGDGVRVVVAYELWG